MYRYIVSSGCLCVQLIEFLSDQNELAAADVLVFVREATQRFEQLRPVIIGKLLDTFPSVKSLKYGKHMGHFQLTAA